MDRVFSARIDEAVYRKIGSLSMRMHTSKKAILERAVTLLEQQFENQSEDDVFDGPCGVWQRDESADETVARARAAFRESMGRHRT